MPETAEETEGGGETDGDRRRRMKRRRGETDGDRRRGKYGEIWRGRGAV